MALSKLQMHVLERIDAGKSIIRLGGMFGPKLESGTDSVSGIDAATVDDLVQRGLLHIEPARPYNPARATRLTNAGRDELIEAGGYAG